MIVWIKGEIKVRCLSYLPLVATASASLSLHLCPVATADGTGDADSLAACAFLSILHRGTTTGAADVVGGVVDKLVVSLNHFCGYLGVWGLFLE